jgi:hypothetical protein
MKILNEVGSLLGSLQSNKILQKISKNKDNGLYKTELEYREALKANLIDVANNLDEPLFVPSFVSPGLAYSEYLNNNVEDILLDLQVLFGEINFIFSKIKSHEVFFDRGIQEIEVLIKKLNQTVESTQIEASADNAFNKTFHNSFIDASNKIDFTNILAKELYYDSIVASRATLDNLCTIDINEGKLTLPKIVTSNVTIAEAKIVTTETVVSDYNVSSPDNNLSNIITANPSESWSHTILTRKPLKEAAKLVLSIDFGDKKEFNSLTLNPNTLDPIYLEDVYVLDANGVKVSLGIQSGLIAESKNFLFKRLISKEVYFVFKQDKNVVIPHNPNEPITLAELQRDASLPLSIDTITGQIKESIKDPSIKNILGLETKSLAEYQLVYMYEFSLSSIVVGNDNYKNKGMYVSKPETYNYLRNIALYTKDAIPMSQHWETGLDMLAGSIEYSLVKKDYDSNARLIKTSNINILPIGTVEILNERLFFDLSKNIALRFLAHKSNGDGSEIEIYRNGELLIRGIDWRFRDRQSVNPAEVLVDTTVSNTVIELTHSADQIANGTYWASYKPRYILEPENAISDKGTRYLENNSVLLPSLIAGQEIASSDIFVQIIIRNHTDSSILTPYIDYYRLA